MKKYDKLFITIFIVSFLIAISSSTDFGLFGIILSTLLFSLSIVAIVKTMSSF